MHPAEGNNPAQFQCGFFGPDATLHFSIRERAREMVNGITYTLWSAGLSGSASFPAAAIKFVFVTRFTQDFRNGVIPSQDFINSMRECDWAPKSLSTTS